MPRARNKKKKFIRRAPRKHTRPRRRRRPNPGFGAYTGGPFQVPQGVTPQPMNTAPTTEDEQYEQYVRQAEQSGGHREVELPAPSASPLPSTGDLTIDNIVDIAASVLGRGMARIFKL